MYFSITFQCLWSALSLLRITGFLDFGHHPVFSKLGKQNIISETICLRPQMKAETPALLGLLESTEVSFFWRTKQSRYLSLPLLRAKTDTVSETLRFIVCRIRTMDKVQRTSNAVLYTTVRTGCEFVLAVSSEEHEIANTDLEFWHV
jgi:hypothetical protein